MKLAEAIARANRRLSADPTNEDRRTRASAAVEAYIKARGDGPDTLETDITDLLTDLEHLWDAYGDGRVFSELVTLADGHHAAET